MIRITSFETTPNPHAVKCVLAEPLGTAPRSYRAPGAAEAAGDALGAALMAIPGVTSVLIHVAFITVVKTPEAGWGPLRRAVRAVVEKS